MRMLTAEERARVKAIRANATYPMRNMDQRPSDVVWLCDLIERVTTSREQLDAHGAAQVRAGDPHHERTGEAG